MEFNINNTVRVKLTPLGRETLKKNHDTLFVFVSQEYLKQHPYVPIKEDRDGWSEWQLWYLMQQLGSCCHNGFNVPFETTIDIIV